MNRMAAVTIIGFCPNVGNGLRGAIVFLKKPGKRFMGALLGFTGGIMLAVVCLICFHAFDIGGMIIDLQVYY